jgi:hypothetical protein
LKSPDPKFEVHNRRVRRKSNYLNEKISEESDAGDVQGKCVLRNREVQPCQYIQRT